MNKTCRFLILLLTCVFVFVNSATVSYAVANEAGEPDANAARELFMALGIDNRAYCDMTAPATREQFLTLLMGLINLNVPAAYGQSAYEDVPANSELASVTNYAMALGIISKAQKFYPSGNVEYPAACKMMVEALGRGPDAASRGGYPYGYTMVASANDLNVGLSGAEYLTNADMYIMLANFAETPVYAITSYSYADGQLHYRVAEGETVLKAYHDITVVEGIVDAANGGYLYDYKSEFEKNSVSIDNAVYKVASGVYCPLGMRVKAYVKNLTETKGEVVFATDFGNKTIVISSLDSPEFSNGTLSYVDASGKMKKLKSSPERAVLYNGRAYGYCTDSDFSIKSGRIEAIDNNEDGVVDVFSVWESEYIEVAYADSYSGVIYDSKYKTNVYLGDDDIYFDSAIDIDSVSQGNVLEVFISKDKKYVKMNVVSGSLSGTVTGFGSDSKIFVDDMAYITTPYFEEFFRRNVEIGKKYSLAVNDDGAIVAVKSFGRSGFKFAYFDVIIKTTDLASKVMVKLFTENGEIEKLQLSDKVRIDDKTHSSAEAYAVLSRNTGSVIRYQENSEGYVSSVITVADSEGIYNPTSDGYNTIKRYRFPNDETQNLMYYKKTGYFVPHFIIDNSTVIFCVSENATDDEDKFSIGNLDFLQNDERIPCSSVRPYNVSYSGCAEVLLYKAPDIVSNNTFGDNAPSGVVASCTRTLDEDGEPMYKTSLYLNDKYTTYYIRNDEAFVEKMNLAAGDVPFNRGDLIRYSASGEYIVNAVKDFDGKARRLINTSGDNQEVHYYYGKLYALGTSSVAVLGDDDNLVYLPVAIGNVCVVDTNDVYTAPKSVLASYLQVGDDACTILVKCRYSTVNSTVIYK
ncbi:MAG: hypothetical protein II998_09615 [Clostridia bacterium]|nr:hypothetical protein [Clostridia bacterium]